METIDFLLQFFMIVAIAFTGLGAAILWRTCIYTRGGIFRPIGRIFDLWVLNGCNPKATFFDKLLRFIAYPLGRCIYCSGFHIAYDIFFLMNYTLELNLSYWWMIPVTVINQLMIVVFMAAFVNGNEDIDRGDWEYMKNTNRLFDWPRGKNKSPLTPEEEDILDKCKGVTNLG